MTTLCLGSEQVQSRQVMFNHADRAGYPSERLKTHHALSSECFIA